MDMYKLIPSWHERARREHWSRCMAALIGKPNGSIDWRASQADELLAEYDKRFKDTYESRADSTT